MENSINAVRIAIWLVTAIGSAMIGLILKSWWDAPRPHLELSTVQLKMDGDPKKRIEIPQYLSEQINSHYYFEELEKISTPEEIQEKISNSLYEDDRHNSTIIQIEKLIELLKTRQSTIDIRERRREFLTVWHERGEKLSNFAKIVLEQKQASLPHSYLTPRTGDYTKNVDIGRRIANLAEIDEEETARGESIVRGPVNVYDQVFRDAHNSNLLRRMWDFLEPQVIIPILTDCKATILVQIDESKKIAKQLDAMIHANEPERLLATVLISNKGGQPFAIRNIGILWLKLAAKNGGRDECIPVTLGSETSDVVTVVEPGSVKALTLRSSMTALQLIAENESLRDSHNGSMVKVPQLEGSRLKLLFDGGAIEAAVSLARAGAKPGKSFFGATAFRAVGAKGDDLILAALKDKGAPPREG